MSDLGGVAGYIRLRISKGQLHVRWYFASKVSKKKRFEGLETREVLQGSQTGIPILEIREVAGRSCDSQSIVPEVCQDDLFLVHATAEWVDRDCGSRLKIVMQGG